MDYLWKKFNIKTFPAETVVFVDGEFRPELSTLCSLKIDKKYDLPIHIIYIGEIAGKKNINIEISMTYQNVFLTAKITNKLPAFLTLFIKNTGKFSKFSGKIIAQNYSDLCIDINPGNFDENTGNNVYTKVVAHPDTKTTLLAKAEIIKECENCESDVGFSVLADKSTKIEFSPSQYISAIPKNAGHSASIYRGSAPQIEYLKTAGLSAVEVKNTLEEAFITF